MRQKIGIGVVAVVLALVLASSAAAASYNARGSVEQVYATGLPAGAQVTLLDPADQVVATRNTNDLGGVLFREVTPGAGYHLRLDTTNELSDALTVLTKADAPPSTDVYNQTIPSDGYGYMTMRDGVKLAYAVHAPTDITSVLTGTLGIPLPDLPPIFSTVPGVLKTPTLVEYSGYGTADPDGPESGISLLANLMGYTVVDVNMRGTGCSGGAYDFFEPLQGLDGYDVIETVARQPWVAHGKVGMFGISFGGISQLFTAQHQPPSLAAITPLSVIDQTQTTLYPGGILNTGFAFSWALDRVHDARPAPDGQPWANDQIAAGDTTCAENQALHPEAADLIEKIRENDHYIPEVADPLSPKTFVDKINVPTLMTCQWTDEQTGGHCPTLASRMTGTDKKWITFTNGTHVDSLMPENLSRLYNFLEIYVAKESPLLKSAIVHAAAPLIYEEVFGISGMTSTPDAIQLNPVYESAKAAFEAQKPIRILYDNGAGSSNPGHPYSGFERSYDSFPPPGTTGRSWYLGEDGALTDGQSGTAADRFTWDQDARPMTNFTGDTASGPGGLWTATPNYEWVQDPAGTAVAYATDPLGSDTTVLGSGSVDVWVRSSSSDVDLQATISEIRPDGKETFVQGGWVSTEHRALDPVKSTELEPVLSLRQEDISPMPPDEFVKVTIPLYYQGHVYRSGSRIRVRISAPSNDQPVWAFAEAQPTGQAEIAIGRGPEMPSRLLLPVTGDGDAPTGLPPCPGLRGEPCRDYQPFQNATASVGGTAAAPVPPLQPPAASAAPPSPTRCTARSKRATVTATKHKKKPGCGANKKRRKSK